MFIFACLLLSATEPDLIIVQHCSVNYGISIYELKEAEILSETEKTISEQIKEFASSLSPEQSTFLFNKNVSLEAFIPEIANKPISEIYKFVSLMIMNLRKTKSFEQNKKFNNLIENRLRAMQSFLINLIEGRKYQQTIEFLNNVDFENIRNSFVGPENVNANLGLCSTVLQNISALGKKIVEIGAKKFKCQMKSEENIEIYFEEQKDAFEFLSSNLIKVLRNNFLWDFLKNTQDLDTIMNDINYIPFLDIFKNDYILIVIRIVYSRYMNIVHLLEKDFGEIEFTKFVPDLEKLKNVPGFENFTVENFNTFRKDLLELLDYFNNKFPKRMKIVESFNLGEFLVIFEKIKNSNISAVSSMNSSTTVSTRVNPHFSLVSPQVGSFCTHSVVSERNSSMFQTPSSSNKPTPRGNSVISTFSHVDPNREEKVE